MLEWELLADGAEAARKILRDQYFVEIHKALNPLETKDYEKIVRGLSRTLKGQAIPVQNIALKKAIGALDVDWNNLKKEERWKVIDAAKMYLGEPVAAAVLPGINQTLNFAAKDLIAKTKIKSVQSFALRIDPSFNAADERTKKFLVGSTGHFVRDHLGEIRPLFAEHARELVSNGLEQGLGSEDISQTLIENAALKTLARTDSYWETIAMVFMNRARTMTQLASFNDAGVDFYTWESVLDEATSMQCRFMHGRRFPVGHAMRTMDTIESSEDPEAIKTLTPFMNFSGNTLSCGTGDAKFHIANVVENVIGQKDKTGAYSNAMSTEALTAAGVHAPPLHGRCRSTIIPDFAPLPAGVPMYAPPEPLPLPPKPTLAEKQSAALAALGDYPYPIDGGPGIVTLPPIDSFYVTPAELPTDVQGFWNDPRSGHADEGLKSGKFQKSFSLDGVISVMDELDRSKVKAFIENPKLLKAASIDLVKMGDKTYVYSGHEAVLAKKLMGEKKTACLIADLNELPAVVPVPPAAKNPIGIHDPTKTITWGKVPLHEGEELNGVKLKPAESGFWRDHKNVDVGEPAPKPLPPGKKQSSGVVVVEPDGRIWIVEPKDHFGGYEHTFPKGKVDAGLTMQQNALKEAFEESGLKVEITGHLGDFEGDTSVTRYYVAKRVGGAPWTTHFESDTVKLLPTEDAEKLLNKKRDKDILAAMKMYKPPAPGVIVPVEAPLPIAQPHPAPAMAPVGSSPDASVILGTKIGAAQGSNTAGFRNAAGVELHTGGFYRGTDGVERYVKFYSDKSQAMSEHLANTLYRDLGHEAPVSMTFEYEGKTGYASEIIKDVRTLADSGLTAAKAKLAMKGFAADVLTGNWDAFGETLDNLVIKSDGGVVRIDNGGTFLMRAKNGRKELDVLNKITEWEKFFDPSVNKSYTTVAKSAGVDCAEDMKKDLLREIKKISALRDAHGGWHGYVNKIAGKMPASDRAAIMDMLTERTKLLEERAHYMGLPTKPKRDRKDVKSGEEVVFGFKSALGTKVKKKLAAMDGSPDHSLYSKMYRDAGVSQSDAELVKSTISSWTGEYRLGSTHQKVYESAAHVFSGGKAGRNTDMTKALERVAATRPDRWRIFLDSIGATDEKVPTHFDLFRGVSGEDYVKDVARAWKDKDATHVQVMSHEVASWTLKMEKARGDFASANAGVVFNWNAPMENTVLDQVADDSNFLSGFHDEHEMIAGPGHDKGHLLPKENQVVRFRYRDYTYAEREELFTAMRSAGMGP